MRFRLPWLTPFRRMPEVIGRTGSTGCRLFYCPDLYPAGSVEAATAGALPDRIVSRTLQLFGASR